MAITVTNGSKEPFQENLRTSQVYDFLVRKNGKEIWRWSADKGFLQVITEFTLAVGQSRQYRETWSQRDNQERSVPAGRYEILSMLKTLPERSTPTVAVEIP